MKKKIALLALAAAGLLSNACEQHKFSETRQLFQEHEHSDAATAEHAEAAKEKAGATPAEAKKEKE